MTHSPWHIAIILAIAPLGVTEIARADGGADFRRDILPILSDNCFTCHGPDANTREGGFRLDVRDSAIGKAKSDLHPIVPGDPDKSELLYLVTSDDPDERMPPADTGKPALTKKQVALLRDWIAAGAKYDTHWAYVAPRRPVSPAAGHGAPAHHPIDAFILARLEEKGLAAAPEADRVTLIRRLYFDLLGLPPSAEEVDAFVNDTSADAYENLVDRLLASEHYGERMATYWLDLVRYADSQGLFDDEPRRIWPYRDYVIDAFNSNKRFDTFTIEQLAGDLLPQPTREQRIASGYNRLLQNSTEGGIQKKEYRAKYAADRVRTTASVWLGVTLGCAECHDHKFDPFTAKDFYRFAAFFADVQEFVISGADRERVDWLKTGEWLPVLRIPREEDRDRIEQIDAELARLRRSDGHEQGVAQRDWERLHRPGGRWHPLRPSFARSPNPSTAIVLERQDDGSVLATEGRDERSDYIVRAPIGLRTIAAVRLEVLPDPSLPERGPGLADDGNFVLSHLGARIVAPAVQPLAFRSARADIDQKGYPAADAVAHRDKRGWGVWPETGRSHAAEFVLARPVDLAENASIEFRMHFGFHDPKYKLGRFRLWATDDPHLAKTPQILPAEILSLIRLDETERTADQQRELRDFFRARAPAGGSAAAQIARLSAERERILKQSDVTTMISVPVKPRTVRVLDRGNWMDETGEIVSPGVPHFLPQPDVADRRLTRLDLARWLVSPDNPLTARVFVNRLWRMYFGRGLSPVLDDLGAQGGSPSHPELLDWLAVEFVDSGWDVKHLVRMIVLSDTYRRSSQVPAMQREADIENRLLARQSSWRIDAESVRDVGLTVSGLLNRKIGGKSVYPYQPPRYWDKLMSPNVTPFIRDNPEIVWNESAGADQYRRGLYTYWKRTALHPSMRAFDAPDRAECTAERSVSNTPVQSLVLLNDPSFVEAARVFAERIMRDGGGSFDERLDWAFRSGVSRTPSEKEAKTLRGLYTHFVKRYDADTASAKALVSVGRAPPAGAASIIEHAAWTQVARAILNLHETITRY